MAIIAKDKGNAKPAPEGLHVGVCCDVVDLGVVESQYGSAHKIQIVWQLDEVNPENKKRFTISRRYTLSLHAKSSLRKDLEAWRGKKFTPEELKGFDVEKLLGACAQIQSVHNASDDGSIFANVAAIMPLAKGQGKIAIDDYVRKKDRTDEQTSGAPTAEEQGGGDDEVPF